MFSYLLLSTICVSIAMLGNYVGDGIFSYLDLFQACQGDPTCFGNEWTYRILYSLAVFYILMALICKLPRPNSFLECGWCCKVPFVIGICIASLFVPNVYYSYGIWLARAVGVGFLCLQTLLFIDFCYEVQAIALQKLDDDARYEKLYVGLCVVLYMLGFLALITTLHHSALECTVGQIMVYTCMVTILALTALSVHENVGLLPVALVSVFLAYMVYDGVRSSPNCSGWHRAPHSIWMHLGSILLAGFVQLWASIRISGSTSDKTNLEEGGLLSTDDEDAFDWSIFHVGMACGSLYVAMVLTNWGVPIASNAARDVNSIAFGVHVATQVMTVLLYVWTIVAPRLFTDRSFSI